ncbi:MAG: hypothetical protein WHT81_00025 [Rectinemataceae bacterium]|nr:hypothetical protein [Spirochaetaceae bacterium]
MAGGRTLRYSERIARRKKRRRIFLHIILVLCICALFRTFFVQSWKIEDTAEAGHLKKGDIVLSAPLYRGLGTGLLYGTPSPGTLVLVSDASLRFIPVHFRLADAVLRFMTLQRVSLLEQRYGAGTGSLRPMVIGEVTTNPDGSRSIRARDATAPGNITMISMRDIAGYVFFRVWPLHAMGLIR